MRVVDRSYEVPAEVERRLRRAFWEALITNEGIWIGLFVGVPLVMAASGFGLFPPSLWLSIASLMVLFIVLRWGSVAAITAVALPCKSDVVVGTIRSWRPAATVTPAAGGVWVTHGTPLGVRAWVEDTPTGCRIVGPATCVPGIGAWIQGQRAPRFVHLPLPARYRK